jgi:hypothetical protein
VSPSPRATSSGRSSPMNSRIVSRYVVDISQESQGMSGSWSHHDGDQHRHAQQEHGHRVGNDRARRRSARGRFGRGRHAIRVCYHFFPRPTTVKRAMTVGAAHVPLVRSPVLMPFMLTTTSIRRADDRGEGEGCCRGPWLLGAGWHGTGLLGSCGSFSPEPTRATADPCSVRSVLSASGGPALSEVRSGQKQFARGLGHRLRRVIEPG